VPRYYIHQNITYFLSFCSLSRNTASKIRRREAQQKGLGHKDKANMTMIPIDDDTAKKLGKDLTTHHPITVYGMAKSCISMKPGFTITSYKVKAVTNDGCDIYVTTCRGDICEMKHGTYKFHPPIESAKDWSSSSNKRIHQIHNTVCCPNPIWLITDPLALVALILCTAVAYGTCYLGMDGIVNAVALMPNIEGWINTIFGSSTIFGYCVIGGFIFAIVAHTIEASIAVYQSHTILKLDLSITLLWGFLVSLVGFPVFSRLNEFTMIVTKKIDDHHDSKSK
jgi:hypothetical protein